MNFGVVYFNGIGVKFQIANGACNFETFDEQGMIKVKSHILTGDDENIDTIVIRVKDGEGDVECFCEEVEGRI